MPEGVTVSHTNRIFVNFARWGDDIPFTVAEIFKGKAVAYPNAEINNWPGRTLANPNAFTDETADQTHFVSVQSVVVDSNDILWALTPAPRCSRTLSPAAPSSSPSTCSATKSSRSSSFRLRPAAVTATSTTYASICAWATPASRIP